MGLYHELSAGFHSIGNSVVVRALDFRVATTRCALCALFEAYDIPYTYYDEAGDAVESPYALTVEERAAASSAAR